MQKIKFTTGTLSKLTAEYYTLQLEHNGEVVYKATLPALDAAEIINKHKNIKLA